MRLLIFAYRKCGHSGIRRKILDLIRPNGNVLHGGRAPVTGRLRIKEAKNDATR
jgi:hypothetical protein